MGWRGYVLVASLGCLTSCTFHFDKDITVECPKCPSQGEGTKEVTYTTLKEEIFKPRCQGCHNEANPRAGFSVETYASIMKAVEKGDPANSLVNYRAVELHDMPPSGPLPDSDQKKITQWIQKGAPE